MTGDITQIDLPKNTLSGLVHSLEVLKNIDDVGLVEFDSKEKALEAYHSEEYKLALEHALVSSNRFVVIVEGV